MYANPLWKIPISKIQNQWQNFTGLLLDKKIIGEIVIKDRENILKRKFIILMGSFLKGVTSFDDKKI